MQHDFLDQAAERILRLARMRRLGQRRDQLPDPLPIRPRHRRVKPHHRRGRGGRKQRLKLRLTRRKRLHLRLHPCGRNAFQKRIDQLVVVALHLAQLRLSRRPKGVRRLLEPVPLRCIFLAEDPHRLVVHQMVL
ncbi:hypothetical protein AP071_15885 [Rhodobacter capsulatus]|nr:hypothetical protein AP073_15775 [Rhodobacter capsulatus]KQB14233.1 hypothetical protein AP071_15885 [Rhodobacter capsulatus]